MGDTLSIISRLYPIHVHSWVHLQPNPYHIGKGDGKLGTVGEELGQEPVGEVRQVLYRIQNLAHAGSLALHKSQLCEDIGNDGIAPYGRDVCQIHVLDKPPLWHAAGGIYRHAVVVHIHMHLAALNEIVAVGQCIHYSFQYAALHVFRNLHTLHGFLIPHGARVAADKRHRVLQERDESAGYLRTVQSIDASASPRLSIPSGAEHTALSQRTLVCHQQPRKGENALGVHYAERAEQFAVEAHAIPRIIAAAHLGEGEVIELLGARAGIKRRVAAVQHQSLVLRSVSHHRLVADAHEGFEHAVAHIIIRCIVASLHVENEQVFAVHALYLQIDLRHGVYALLYLLADKLRIALGVGKPHHGIVVCNAKQQAAAHPIGKGADTLHPALHLAAFHFLLLVVLGRFTDIFSDVHIFIPLSVPSTP